MGNVSNLAEAREARRLQKPRTNDGKGFALLHRKIMDLPFYKDAEASHLWVHLLLRANHEQTLVSTDFGDVICERGEFVTGRNTLAMETGLTANRVKSLLRKFQNLGMITIKSNNRFTVLKVVKYDEYQSFFCPADVQPVSTDNNILNNLLPNGSKYVANDQQTAEEKKPRLSCDEVWQCLKDELPEARGWRCLTDERRNLIRTFWGKANKIARNLDGKPMDMEGFRSYLRYIAQNCRWMLEDRPDQKSGKTWRRMKFDSFLTAKLYIEVREGDRDDR
ncbi:DNA replication protein [Salmonella enterica]|nr:DNA replication protein [Salmonella enterica]EDR4378026.1 DNA replication protein [Salmonella enterica]EEG5735134.1 DNA replication protein [Salmonella enterica]EEG6158993.1 DNA replication protein [Salmonella enterica]EEH7435327.1 DNA replication protein [Salmonella enterica]